MHYANPSIGGAPPAGGRGRRFHTRAAYLIAALLGVLVMLAVPLSASAQMANDSAGAPPVADTQPAFPTGFTIANPAILTYFTQRGGEATFGDLISREFQFEGEPAQLFQRALLRVQPDNSVQPMSLMDAGLLPYSHFNGLTVPAADPALTMVTPGQQQPGYGTRLIDFVLATVPDAWQTLPVDFQSDLLGTVTCNAAFPDSGCQTDLLPLLSLEVWGAPTSAPAADPTNPNFVYQRFDRGVLMYNATDGSTQWLSMGSFLKEVLTGQSLPADLASDAAASPLLRQYDPAKAHSVVHPAALPNTDLTNAFTPDAG